MISNKAVAVVGLPFNIKLLKLDLHGSMNFAHVSCKDIIFPDLLC